MLEILVSLGIFSLLIVSVASLTLSNFSFYSSGGLIDGAESLADEAVQAVKSIGARDWDELRFSRSGVADISGRWELAGEGTVDRYGGFERAIDFQPVYRDSAGNLAASTTSGAELDAFSKLVSINVSWSSDHGTPQAVDRSFLISNRQTLLP